MARRFVVDILASSKIYILHIVSGDDQDIQNQQYTFTNFKVRKLEQTENPSKPFSAYQSIIMATPQSYKEHSWNVCIVQ